MLFCRHWRFAHLFALCHVSSYRRFPSVDDDNAWLFLESLGAIVCREGTQEFALGRGELGAVCQQK